MRTFRICYYSNETNAPLVALIPADSSKQALTRFRAAGFQGNVMAVLDLTFDSSLFNF